MRKNRISIALALTIVLIVSWFYFRTSPALVHIEITKYGAGEAIHRLFNRSMIWKQILIGIKSGDSDWLKVAAEMKPGLDTHPGEEIMSAINAAVISNPSEVMSKLLPVYGLDLVCRPPDLHGGPKDDLMHRQETALLSLSSSPLQSVSADCVRKIHQEQRNIETRRQEIIQKRLTRPSSQAGN